MSAPESTPWERTPLELYPAAGGSDAQADPQEISWPDVSYRAGLLLGAVLFFQEGVGWPAAKNMAGIAGIFLAFLITVTMVFDWRILGDWRLGRVLALQLGLLFTLTFPAAAAFQPRLEGSLLPEFAERILAGSYAALTQLPMLETVLLSIQGLMVFVVLVIMLLVLLFGGGSGKRGGVAVAGALLALLCLFFHPRVETVIGFLFLGWFLAAQWQATLILPAQVARALNPAQRDFLRELLVRGYLSPGETKLLLDNRAGDFAQLVDFQLVQYDQVLRDILPGRLLLHDPAAGALDSLQAVAKRFVWIFLGLVYFVMPDFIPGPVDDVIVLAICSGAGFRVVDLLKSAFRRTSGRNRPQSLR